MGMRVTRRPARALRTGPELLQAVELTVRRTVGDPIVRQTKVLDIEMIRGDETIVVACPDGLDPLEHHFEASVAWTSPLGQVEYAVTTRPAHRAYGPVWLLTPCGPLAQVQKRQYFRADVSLPVIVRWRDEPPIASSPGTDDDTQPHLLAGVVVDLSEGGLLASIRGTVPPVGAEVESVLRIDGEEIAQAATVVRHVSFRDGRTGLALAFADPSLHGDRLRRVAFEAERRRQKGS